MNDNTFKSTEALFSKIKEDFRSFDNANLIDEGRFHKDVKYVLHLLGLRWYRQAEDILEICNYKAVLPDDFNKVEIIYKCDSTVLDNATDGVLLRKLTFDHYPNPCDRDPHGNTCDQTGYSDCIFNRQEEILVQRSNMVTRYSRPTLLRPGNINTQKLCKDKCANFYTDNAETFTIQNGHLYTNFPSGSVYVGYTAFPLDEEGYPLIPDNENIEKCIEYYIKTNILESLWVNTEADVERKLSYFKQEYKIHLAQAMYESKLPSFESMIKKIRLNRKSLNVYYQM
jgi:hypothetical protein